MAKDPAFLFYPGDWITGTMILSRHQKGCYMDLLIAQFNNGPLSFESIKTILGQDQAAWTVLSKKFKQDSEGNYYNERLVAEIEKRKKFTESKISNGKKGGRPSNKTKSKPIGYDKVNLPENKNEDENEEGEKGVGKGEGFFLNELSMETELSKIELINVQEFIQVVCEGKKLLESEVRERWKAFKIDNFKKREWKNSYEDVLSYFRHSVKNEINKNKKLVFKSEGAVQNPVSQKNAEDILNFKEIKR